jgi:hypothetical protein
MVFFSRWTLLCGVYHHFGLVFYHQLCNRNNTVVIFMFVTAISLVLPIVSNLFPVSYEQNVKEDCSCSNIAAPGEAFNTVWYVEQIAHATLSMNVSMSAGSTKQPCQVQRCTSWFIRPDGCAHKWHSLVDS